MQRETSVDAGQDRRKGMALAFLGMLAVSTDSFFIRLAEVDGFDLTFWVGLLSAAALTTLIWMREGRGLHRVVREGGWPLWLAGLLQAGSTSVFVLAVTKTSVANVVAIIAAAPLVAAVLSWLILREATSRRVWVAVAVVMVGVAIIVAGSVGSGSLTGDLLALLAIAQFGCSLVVLRAFPGLHRMAMVALGGLGMALIAVVPATLFGHRPRTWLAIALMGLVFGPLARVLIAEAPRHLPAAEVGLFAPIETVAASLWAWLFFHEAPETATVVGGTIIVVAVLWGTWQPKTT